MRKTRVADTLERKDFSFKFTKEIDDTGRFEGYAAAYDNVDSQGDRIWPHAFKKTLQENPEVPILWQHDTYEPIGVSLEMEEDIKGSRGLKGLFVAGQLTLGVQRADEARLLMIAKAIKGLSIGYKAIKPDWSNGVRNLREIALKEWSPVTFPANGLAAISNVKGLTMAEKMYGLYDDETEQVGYLLAMISAGTAFLAEEADEGDDPEDVAAMQSVLGALANLLALELAEVGADEGAMSARLTDIFFKGSATLPEAQRPLVERGVSALQALLTNEPPAPGTRVDDGAAVKDAAAVREFVASLRAA